MSYLDSIQSVITSYEIASEDDVSGQALSAIAGIIAGDEDGAEWMFEEINESREGYCSIIDLFKHMTDGYVAYMAAAKAMVRQMTDQGLIVYYSESENAKRVHEAQQERP